MNEITDTAPRTLLPAAKPATVTEPAAVEPAFTGDEYAAVHDERLSETLDLDTWRPGSDLVEMQERVRQEITEALEQEKNTQRYIREQIFPALRERSVPEGGVYAAPLERVEKIQRQLLFNGAVEACDGTVATHDTLPVTITQIGVCLVSYQGDQGSWVHRLFRRDLRSKSGGLVEETMKLLERRYERGALDQESTRDRLSSLARRGIMAYAERAILLHRSDALWRLGHGSPTPYELVTGSGMPELLRKSLELMREFVIGHQRFVFVPSATAARHLLTIGDALRPLEYAIVDTQQETLSRIAEGHYRGQEWAGLQAAVREFVDDCGDQILVGIYRASLHAPPQLFYAHVDYVHEAALIAMADSLLQEHRGFPMLIDLAHTFCSTTFGAEAFSALTQLAYAEAGAPFRYLSERKTRR
ncbi:MAG: hypothetical protein WAM82_15440 [Thermoanaerobaculia bacterium]